MERMEEIEQRNRRKVKREREREREREEREVLVAAVGWLSAAALIIYDTRNGIGRVYERIYCIITSKAL